MNNSSITIACSTFGDRVTGAYAVYKQCKAMAPEMPFVLMHQVPKDITLAKSTLECLKQLKAEPDVQYYCLENRGLTISRNAAISACKTKYMWIMDDDIIFKPDFFDQLQQMLERDKEAACHTFESLVPSGNKRAKYPQDKAKLSSKDLLRIASWEMILDIEHLNRLNVRMREDMGVGTEKVILGEESVLVSDIINAGGTTVHHKKTILIHDDLSTGVITNEKTVFSKGVVIKRCFSGLARFRFFVRDLNKLLKDRDKKIGSLPRRLQLIGALTTGVYLNKL